MIEIDGVPFFTAPGSGPVRGGIGFRVGLADENFGNHGITHLVEHLAFDGLLNQSTHANGMTTDTYTLFYVSGEPDEVIDFLNRIAANLAKLATLPVDRIDKEKEILRTEQTVRSDAVREARCTLHGFQDFGLSGVAEAGLNRLTAEDLAAWAARYFTAGNAAGFLIGLDDADALTRFHLDLPAGQPQPVPTPSYNAAVLPLPRFYPYQTNCVLVQAIVERGAAVRVLEQLANVRFWRELREIDALSYSPRADTELVSGQMTRFSYLAETRPDNGPGVAGCLIDALAALCHGQFSDEDLEQARSACLEGFSRDDAEAGYVMSRVVNRLHGCDDETMDQARERYLAVTREDVVRAARAVRDNAFWMAPVRSLDWAGIEPTNFHIEPVEGHEFSLIGDEGKIIVSDQGVTRITKDLTRTVLFAQCVGVQTYPDGLRVVVGQSGVMVPIEPTLYQGMTPALLAALVDARVTPDRIEPMPARRPSEIPSPATPAPVAPVGAPIGPPSSQYAAPAQSLPGPYQPAAPSPYQSVPSPYAPSTYPSTPAGPYQPTPPVAPGFAPTPPGFPPEPVYHPQAPMYPPVPAATWQPPKKRSVGLIVLFIILAIIFGLAALLCLLLLLVFIGDTTPEATPARILLLVVLALTAIPTIIFIWQAVRASR